MERKPVSILALLFIVSALSFAAQPLKPNFPWDCPSPKGNIANDTIFAGFIGDLSGAAFIMGSSLGFAVGGSMGRIFLEVGGLGFATGGLLFDIGVNKRHVTLEKKYRIKAETRNLSRSLALGSTILGFGGVLLTEVNSLAMQDGTIAVLGMVAFGAGALIEMYNIFVPRLEWIRDINFAVSGKREKKISFEEDFTLAPRVLAAVDPSSGEIRPAFGLTARIRL